jgi:hypothetical protein
MTKYYLSEYGNSARLDRTVISDSSVIKKITTIDIDGTLKASELDLKSEMFGYYSFNIEELPIEDRDKAKLLLRGITTCYIHTRDLDFGYNDNHLWENIDST